MRLSAFQFPSLLINLLAICWLGGTSTSVCAAESTVDGWGDIKFGMTPNQVRAIPGISWGRLSSVQSPSAHFDDKGMIPRRLVPYTFELSSSSTVNVYGHDFKINALFDAQTRLTGFSAVHSVDGSSPIVMTANDAPMK